MNREEMLRDILARLEGKAGKPFKQNGDWFNGRCPAHDDQHASLGVRLGDKRIIFKCLAGCSVDTVAASIGKAGADLFYDHKERKARQPVTLEALAKEKGFGVDYLRSLGCYEEGGAVMIPYLLTDGSHAPRTRRRMALKAKEGSTWTGTAKDGAPVPYGLDRLPKAREAGYLILVEGETNCWALWSIGQPALGIPGAEMTRKLVAPHVAGIGRVYVHREPDKGGAAFVRGMVDRLKAVGYAGMVLVIDSGEGVKAPHDLMLKTQDAFAAAFKARIEAARPAAEVLNDLHPASPATAKEGKPKKEPQGSALNLREFDLWPAAVNGAALLDEMEATFRRHIVLPDGAAPALALWTLWTHCYDLFNIAPRLALGSPEKRCGKTLTLTLLNCLCPRAILASNISSAATFRIVEAGKPTLLIDEADTFVHDNEELRGILNSGHTRAGAFVIRLVEHGKDFEPRKFSTWGPIAVAAIGRLPETLMDRSIVIQMRRKGPGERVERVRADKTDNLTTLGRMAARWALSSGEALAKADPQVPDAMNDRAQDNWRPLFAIADLAGGDWPEKARRAAMILSGDGQEEDSSVRVMLLADIADLITARHVEHLASADICSALAEREDRPWPEWRHGKPISTRQVAGLLKPFGIVPHTIRVGTETAKGYALADFADAFARYLPSSRSVTSSQPNSDAAFPISPSVTCQNDVTDRKLTKPASLQLCDAVTDRRGVEGQDDCAEALQRACAGEAVGYKSPLLGEEVLFVPDDWQAPPGEARTVYRLGELRQLADVKLSAQTLKAVHAVKSRFNGTVTGTEGG